MTLSRRSFLSGLPFTGAALMLACGVGELEAAQTGGRGAAGAAGPQHGTGRGPGPGVRLCRAHGGNARSDLWTYDLGANRWSEVRAPGTAPAARFGHGAVWDRSGGRMLVFSGQAGTDFFNDVWEFGRATGAWRQLTSGTGPAPRYGIGMDIDVAGKRVVTSHGFTNSGRFDDTWTLDVGSCAWREASPGSGQRPEKRCLLRTLWDPEKERLLLFGGQSNTRPYLGDLWALQADRGWTEVQPAEGSPSARSFYSASPDLAGRRFLLFGGKTMEGDRSDLWSFDLVQDRWSLVSSETPAPVRSGHDSVYVPSRHSLLVFGGSGASELPDLWKGRV